MKKIKVLVQAFVVFALIVGFWLRCGVQPQSPNTWNLVG